MSATTLVNYEIIDGEDARRITDAYVYAFDFGDRMDVDFVIIHLTDGDVETQTYTCKVVGMKHLLDEDANVIGMRLWLWCPQLTKADDFEVTYDPVLRKGSFQLHL